MANICFSYVFLQIAMIIFVIDAKKLPENHESSSIYKGEMAGTVTKDNKGKTVVVNNGDYPYMISIQDDYGHFCGGALIRDNAILTAAHCLKKRSPRELTIVAGVLNSEDTKLPTRQERTVKRLLPHSDFGFPSSLNNDIGIIIVWEPFELNKYVNTINLPEYSERDSFVDDKIRLIGWGQTELDDYPDDLLYTDVRVVRNQICVDKKKEAGYYTRPITDQMMCFLGDTLTEGSGGGDSGGPAIKMISANPKQHVLVGVCSWSNKSSKKTVDFVASLTELGDIYTNVAALRPWIDQTLSTNM